MKKISSPSLENLTLKSTLAPPPISTPILPCLVPIRDFDVTKALAGRKWRKRDSKLPPPSRKFVKFVEQATLSLSSLRLWNSREQVDERKAFARWKWNAAEIADVSSSKTRVARPEVGAAGQKFWFGRSDAGRGIFPTIGMLDTRITQIEILVSPTDICRIPAIHVSVHRSRERERIDDWSLGFVFRGGISDLFFFLRGRGLFGIFVGVLAPSRNLFPLE